MSTAGKHGPARRLSILPTSSVVPLEVVVEGRGYKLQVNAERTIEQLACHIESIFHEQNPTLAPFQCHVLMDEDGVALSFNECVGDALVPNAVLTAASAVDLPRTFLPFVLAHKHVSLTLLPSYSAAGNQPAEPAL